MPPCSRPAAPTPRPAPPPGTGPRWAAAAAPPAPARIWPRLAHTPPRRPGPGNRPIPTPRAHTARFPRPARPHSPRLASPSVCLCATPPALLARLRVCPRRPPPKPAAPSAAAPAQPLCASAIACPGTALCPPRPGPKWLCPQGGIKSLKVGRWRPPPPLA